ncbi:hypothetical protein HELRODRAFT_79989, partial [Helobdella robusta]|uniref:Neurotransmitter-gated ion-channel ligand-binding domain-containing protein n=1 Tax=Helobdella robusta TaxID=6412 RepID=T1G3W0_HELRO
MKHLKFQKAKIISEAQLFWTLFHDYNPNVRPVSNKSSPITVWVEYYLFTIVFIVNIEKIHQKWIDSFLKWNMSEHHNISSIVTNAKDVWVPDISVRNGVESLSVVDHKSPQKLIIKSNGEISFDFVRETRVFCHLDFTYFPFDQQKCQIYIDSWTYNTEWVVFKASVNKINLKHHSAHEQWHVLDTRVKLNERVYPEIKSNFSEIIFIMHLKRYPLFHFTYFIYPCVVTFVFAQLVFLVPTGTRKKIGFSITVLLSFTVFLDTMFYVLPEIGDYVPYLTVYVVFVMFMSSLFLFTTIIILILHHHSEDEPPPNWLQYIIL